MPSTLIAPKVFDFPTNPPEGGIYMLVKGKFRSVICWDGYQWQSMSRIPSTYGKVICPNTDRFVQIPNLVPNVPVQVFHSMIVLKSRRLTYEQEYTIDQNGLITLTDLYMDSPQVGDIWEFIIIYSN